jgi:hypothetical protein
MHRDARPFNVDARSTRGNRIRAEYVRRSRLERPRADRRGISYSPRIRRIGRKTGRFRASRGARVALHARETPC